MTHTKEKWGINLYGPSQNSKNIHIGPIGYVDGVAMVKLYEGKEDEQKAIAHHIVHCVNNFDDLLEALEEMIACIGKDGYFPQCGKTITDKARAAIAEAKGTKQ